MLLLHQSARERARGQANARGHGSEDRPGGGEAARRATAMTVSLRAAPRRISRNCRNLRKYGERAFVRRSHSHSHGGARQGTSDRNNEEEIEQLARMRDEIRRLDERLSLLDSATLTMHENAQTVALRTLQTYFAHVTHGYNPTSIARDLTAVKPFIMAVYTKDISCQDFTGIDMLLQQWEFISKNHAEIRMVPDRIVALPVDIDARGNDVYRFQAAGCTTCRISRNTLVHIFPHIIQDEALAQWLIGKEYSFDFTMSFQVNGAGRVFKFDSTIELTSALLSLLQDPMGTIKMVESSQWTASGNIRGVQSPQIHDILDSESTYPVDGETAQREHQPTLPHKG